METVIDVRDVSKAFWIPSVRRQTVREHVLGVLRPRDVERLQVLDGISFTVRRGEAIGIMGRNGSGKSTLLKILCGIYPPDRGDVIVSAAITPILELGVGWNLELDAVDNVFLIGAVMGLSLAEIRESMTEILAFAEVERFAHLQLKHYSSGMSARLAYAVAFKAVRDILILDEILAVGDAGFRERCEARYRELRALGHTIIIVSHTPELVTKFCDRAMLIEGGRIVAEGSPRDVSGQYLSVMTSTA